MNSATQPTSETAEMSADADFIRVRGARVHNLRNIDVDIPRNKLVVITGVSGSGKSSLAFDTIFAEGQRRYLECLSARTRQFLNQLERPDVDVITGLPPTIAVEQRVGSAGIRSTLSTVTEIHDYLRILFARAGQAHCPDCGVPVSQQSVDTIVERILGLEDRSKVMLLAPLVLSRKGTHRDVFERICKAGFVRARVDGEIIDAGSPPDLARSEAHTIEAVVDRIVVKSGIEERLRESVELALKHGEGACLVSRLEGDIWLDRLFSSRFCCPECGTSFPPLEPRTFSFNSPYGACEKCRGLGRLIPSELRVGSSRLRNEFTKQPLCEDCTGARLAPIGRAVKFGGMTLHELCAMQVSDAAGFVGELCIRMKSESEHMDPAQVEAAKSALPEIDSRLGYLNQVGLDYLTLDRPAVTLSGGEFQRARLSGALGSGLTGVCYVLDEPTIGLHSRDTRRLIDVMTELRDRGNSIVVVEHDSDVMTAADWLIDLGPGAGREGGLVTDSATPDQLDANISLTGRYLQNPDAFSKPTEEQPDAAVDQSQIPKQSERIRIDGASLHNLQDVTAEFPLNSLVVVTGVSGSGKSSLITQTLVPALRHAIANRWTSRSAEETSDESKSDWSSIGLELTSLSGYENVDRIVVVDQSPIGRNGRSCPATQSGLWDEIRKLLAKTRDSRLRGFKARRFSFNAKDGRCAGCGGTGSKKVEMSFLPDVYIGCPDCRGARFNPQTLGIRFREKNAADILSMRVDEAAEFFSAIPRVKAVLDVMCDVGLGYLQLGQSALTLSGGEAQRVKLASELSKGTEERMLYILDEPTTGLHAADVARLIDLLKRLIQRGHSVLVVEHNSDVVRAADAIIELESGKVVHDIRTCDS